MDDALTFESPVATATAPTLRMSSENILVLTDESATPKVLVRGATDTAAALALDAAFGTSRSQGSLLICGQRPTEWLIVGDDAVAYVAGLDQAGHVSVVDHTHARALFRLTGAASAQVLEKVCGLDWADSMTPDGAVVSASVAKVVCDIARNDFDGNRSYRIACDRSFGQYLFDVLLDAGAEFGITTR